MKELAQCINDAEAWIASARRFASRCERVQALWRLGGAEHSLRAARAILRQLQRKARK